MAKFKMIKIHLILKVTQTILLSLKLLKQKEKIQMKIILHAQLWEHKLVAHWCCHQQVFVTNTLLAKVITQLWYDLSLKIDFGGFNMIRWKLKELISCGLKSRFQTSWKLYLVNIQIKSQELRMYPIVISHLRCQLQLPSRSQARKNHPLAIVHNPLLIKLWNE